MFSQWCIKHTKSSRIRLSNALIEALFGGFHLKSRFIEHKEPIENILVISQILKDKSVKNYYTGHCTGSEAYDLISGVLQDRLHHFYPGLILNY